MQFCCNTNQPCYRFWSMCKCFWKINSLFSKKKILAYSLCGICLQANSQDLEPRVYANLPKGTNAVAVVYALAAGNVVADPSLPIADFNITTNNIGLAYVRTFGLAGKLSRIQVTAPFVFMTGQLKLNGQDTSGARTGFGDMRIRFGMNLLGSPALDKKDFRQYKQETIVGASLVVSVPMGLYYKDKRINIGTNRWAFKPELGISRRFIHVYAELYTGVWFYTDNNQWLINHVEKQKPVFSIQGHASYYFKNQMWVGVNGNWFNGGETTVDEVPAGSLIDNWRVGITWSVPIARSHSLKLQFNTGAFTSTGLDYNMVSLGYQYIFF